MNLLPKKIVRLDDGAEFLLNEINQLYHLWYPDLPSEGGLGYSYDRLMTDSRSMGKFKVADGSEDLLAMKKRWLDSIKSNNDGHGNEE